MATGAARVVVSMLLYCRLLYQVCGLPYRINAASCWEPSSRQTLKQTALPMVAGCYLASLSLIPDRIIVSKVVDDVHDGRKLARDGDDDMGTGRGYRSMYPELYKQPAC